MTVEDTERVSCTNRILVKVARSVDTKDTYRSDITCGSMPSERPLSASDVRSRGHIDRRTALKSLAAVGSVTLAGCSSVLGLGQSGTVLGKIEVINSSFVSNRIRLIVVRGEDNLVDRELSLSAIDAESGTRSTIIEPSWSDTRGQYTIHAHHIEESGDRESNSREYTFTEKDYDRYYGDSQEDPGCIGALVKVGSLAETENAAIGISPTYMENPCDGPDSK